MCDAQTVYARAPVFELSKAQTSSFAHAAVLSCTKHRLGGLFRSPSLSQVAASLAESNAYRGLKLGVILPFTKQIATCAASHLSVCTSVLGFLRVISRFDGEGSRSTVDHVDSIAHTYFVGYVVYWTVRATMRHPSRICLD